MIVFDLGGCFHFVAMPSCISFDENIEKTEGFPVAEGGFVNDLLSSGDQFGGEPERGLYVTGPALGGVNAAGKKILCQSTHIVADCEDVVLGRGDFIPVLRLENVEI